MGAGAFGARFASTRSLWNTSDMGISAFESKVKSENKKEAGCCCQYVSYFESFDS